MRLFVQSVGLVAPGLAGWQQGRTVLAGSQPYASAPLEAFKPNLLPANERRRTTPLIKLALQTAEDALQGYGGEMGQLASVFASAEGDAEVADKICRALILPERPVSPTQFHNSVHNAPAGYWTIASGSRCATTSIAAGSQTFALGLMEAATVAAFEQQDVMLLAYDYPLPPPLDGHGLVSMPCGIALILSVIQGASPLASLELSLQGQACVESTLPAELQPLREANPAATGLSLLAHIATGSNGQVLLPCSAEGCLHIGVSPC